MGRHLVLTVHGIGEQRPGETVDAVVGAATTQFVEDGKVTKAAEPVEVHRDLIELAEKQFDGDPRKAQLFPVHLRRVRRAGEDSSQDDAVFTEVYWADKSPAPKGPFWTAFDLMKVILGLGYLAMDNVENTRTAPAVGVVHLFTWIFYGLIAPLNALLFVGAATLLLDRTGVDVFALLPVPIYLCILWAVGLGVGYLLMTRVAKSYLVRIFSRGLILCSLILAGISLFDPGVWATTPFEALDAFLDSALLALEGSWLLAIVLAVVVYLSTLGFAKPDLPQGVRLSNTLYPSICAVMVMLWMVFSAALWLLFQQAVTQLSTPRGAAVEDASGLLHDLLKTHLEGVLNTLPVAAIGLAALLAAAIVLAVIRSRRRDRIYREGEWLRRVILNNGLRLVIGGFMVAVSVAAGSQQLVVLGRMSEPLLVPQSGDAISAFILAAILALGVFIYNQPGLVAGGLGVARDIVTYAVVHKCLWREADLDTRKENYLLRREINARFKRVLQYALPAYKPRKLTVISHSQGTVIATQMLQDPSIHKLLAAHGVNDITLVTMGSPVTHIYRHYFQEHFQVSHADMAPGTTWHNIHRADDFVGTTIDGALASDDMNLPVEAGGHIGYFTDHQVWRRLYKDVGFTLFLPQAKSPTKAASR